MTRIVGEKSVWVSGLYVLDEGLMPTVIVATADPDLFDVTVYNYSFIGLGDEHFFTYERLIWPIGAEQVLKFVNCGDGDDVELDSILDASMFPHLILRTDRRHSIATELNDLPYDLASVLEKLDTFPETVESDDDWTLPELKTLFNEYPDLKNRPSPNFWLQS